MEAKFNVGDRIARTGYEIFSSERMTIDEIICDNHPICPELWYICTNDGGRKSHGLVGVVDKCFHKIDN